VLILGHWGFLFGLPQATSNTYISRGVSGLGWAAAGFVAALAISVLRIYLTEECNGKTKKRNGRPAGAKDLKPRRKRGRPRKDETQTKS
jgi:hypothetical protein